MRAALADLGLAALAIVGTIVCVCGVSLHGVHPLARFALGLIGASIVLVSCVLAEATR